MTQRVEALVVGGGISGLVCAYALRKAGIDALLVEASDRVGGAIRTDQRDGYLFESGPQSFSGTAQMLQLFDEIGIRQQVVEAPARVPRYVLVNGTLQKVPMSPPALLGSRLVGVGTKLALLLDFGSTTVPPTNDESIADFVRRKFSAEMLDRLVGPFVSGVYAGDPEKLSLRSAFPMVHDAEKRKGSVIRGMLSKDEKKILSGPPRQRPTLLSFRGGTQTFPDALAAKLGDRVRRNASVTSVVRDAASSTFQVTVRTEGAEELVIVAYDIIVTTSTFVAATLLGGIDPTIASLLAKIEYAPIAVVSLGYSKSEVGDLLNGFGFLIPRSAGVRTLGTVWNSSLFPNRAPDGQALLTSFIGGATDPLAVKLSPDELAAIVHKEISTILKIRSGPA
ncbi:MAG: protoporphyrinogen oxidase, partial [Acidobacteria bacterium]|nr:protoporphyrinogen oxidase [Acidobacteriota bacterium]